VDFATVQAVSATLIILIYITVHYIDFVTSLQPTYTSETVDAYTSEVSRRLQCYLNGRISATSQRGSVGVSDGGGGYRCKRHRSSRRRHVQGGPPTVTSTTSTTTLNYLLSRQRRDPFVESGFQKHSETVFGFSVCRGGGGHRLPKSWLGPQI